MDSALHPHMIDSYVTSCDHVRHILGPLLDTLGITQVWCWKDASMTGVSYDGEHISSHCTLILTNVSILSHQFNSYWNSCTMLCPCWNMCCTPWESRT